MEDVIIVGAGPAGNGTALDLAKAGHKVTVLDCKENPGDKACTGIVSVECLREFPAASPVVLRSANSATVVSPAGRRLHLERERPQAYIIDRESYVAGMAHQAQEAGATYLLGQRVTRVQRHPDRVEVDVDGGTARLEAQVLVVASGFGTSITKRLGLGRVGDFALGVQVEVLAPDVAEVEVYMGEAVAPGFFGWLVPTSNGKALVGLWSRHKVGQHLGNLLATLQAQGKVVTILGRPRRWGIPLKPLQKTVGNRVVVVGDAAGQVKPTTGGGIYFSLLSGRIAAKAIDRALSVGDFSAAALGQYEEGWKALLGTELDTGYKIRRTAERLADWQVDQVLKAIASNGFLKDLLASPDLCFDWHAPLARKVLGIPAVSESLRLFGATASGMRSIINWLEEPKLVEGDRSSGFELSAEPLRRGNR